MLKTTNSKPPIWVITLLTAMYTAGIIGLNIDQTSQLFKFLTPFNLITSVGFLLYFHEYFDKNSIIFFVLGFLVGFLVELVGVNTGKIFGIYEYQTTLGFKIWGVPPIIGLNWLLLVYCIGIVFNLLKTNTILKSIFGAFFLTIFDFIAEPVAIKFEMWHWFDKNPPFQNYIAWFLVAFCLLFFFNSLHFTKKNQIAIFLLILQVYFFSIQRLILEFF